MQDDNGYYNVFQSTLPVRGATGQCRPPHEGSHYFNPRSP